MTYSDWQLRRIRHALKHHHWLEGEQKKRGESWRRIAQMVNGFHRMEASAGDTENFAERIRQFVEGTPAEGVMNALFADEKRRPLTEQEKRRLSLEGKWLYPVPKRLPDIVACITDEECGILRASSLRNFDSKIEAPLRLIEYLDPDYARCDPQALNPLKGAYRSRRQVRVGRKTKHVQSEIDLARVSESGVIYLTELEEWYEVDSWEHFDSVFPDEREERRSGCYEYAGWGVVSPEQSLIVFMKLVQDQEGEDSDQNRIYLMLGRAEDDLPVPDKPVSAIFVLEHEAPVLFSGRADAAGEDLLAALSGQAPSAPTNEERRQDLGRRLERNILVFEKVSKFVTEGADMSAATSGGESDRDKAPEKGDAGIRFRRTSQNMKTHVTPGGQRRYERYAQCTPAARRLDQETYFALEACLARLEDLRPDIRAYLEEQGASAPEGLGRAFLREVGRGNLESVGAMLAAGFPLNYQDPRSGKSALHKAAMHGARQMARFLAGLPGCNILLRDRLGRLADELAFVAGKDEELAEELFSREVEQARRQGVELTLRPG